MKLRKLTLIIFSFVVVIVSCKSDDDGDTTTTVRDRAEVYAEDLEEIETFLETHYYNYEEFESNPAYSEANDDFKIVFTALTDDSTETPLMDRPELKFKMVVDPNDEEITYKMYYLEVREGQGEEVHYIDEAFVNYEGSTTDYTIFDNSINPTSFELTSVLNGGVVTGFREALIEFKTATNYSDNGDGTETYHNHGIGAVFIPSGIGYFSQTLTDVSSYTPLIFTFSVFDSVLLDHDNDGIPSYLEDLDENSDVFDDDTNEDSSPNFFDADDDGDGYNTVDEIELISFPETEMSGFTTKQDARTYFNTSSNIEEGEAFRSITVNNDGTFTLKTFTTPDSNGNGTPDYLDNTYPVE